MVMTRNNAPKPQYELWRHRFTEAITETAHIIATMMAILLLSPIGVIANSINISSNASYVNTSRLLNNSSNNGAITNELVVTHQPLLLASITQNNGERVMVDNIRNNGALNINPIQLNGSDDAIINMSTKSLAAIATATTATVTMPIELDRTTKTITINTNNNNADNNGKDNSNNDNSGNIDANVKRIQPIDAAGISNAQRDHSPTISTQPITTNKPHVSPFTESMPVRQKLGTASAIVNQPRQYQPKHHHEHHFTGPFFEGPLNPSDGALSVAVHLYTEGIFNCRVGMLKDKTVMWVRRTTDKFSLLTVGNITYSGDPRIKVTFQYPNNWRLHINPMLKDDAGLYMCQVSTHPPRVFATNVTVMPPAIRVVDEQGNEIRDRYYKIGSTIDLTCQVATTFITKNSTNTPGSRFSLLQDRSPAVPASTTLFPPVINAFSVLENEIDVTERQSPQITSINSSLFERIRWTKDGESITKDALFNRSATGGWIVSRLSILSAERQHSGIYSCSIINSTSATVDVQILNGEIPAAVQHSVANRISQFHVTLRAVAALLVILYISC